MPRVLGEKMAPWAGASVAVVSFAALLLRGATMPDPDTQLKAAIVMWFGLIQLEWILAPMRRHSEHWFVQYGAMAGYYLPFPLAVFAANTVRYSSDSDEGHISAAIMVVLYSYACNVNVYTTLGDSPFGGWRFVRTCFCLFSLWSLAAKRNTEKNEKGQALPVAGKTLFFFIPLFVAVPYSMSRISSRQVQGAKACADSMKEKAKLPSPFFSGDANNNQYGCKYLRYLLTVESLDCWSSGIDMNDTPDISISYIFFKLLTRRFFGFDCAEEGNAKVRDFALKDLMLPDYKRAFAIVEVQLAFLHEFFFGTYWIMLTPFPRSLPSSLQLVFLSIHTSCISNSIFFLTFGEVHTAFATAVVPLLTSLVARWSFTTQDALTSLTGRTKSASTHLSKTMIAALSRRNSWLSPEGLSYPNGQLILSSITQ